jgi:hypothetical protein
VKESDLPLPVSEPDAPALPALREAYYEAGAQIAHAVGAWRPFARLREKVARRGP